MRPFRKTFFVFVAIWLGAGSSLCDLAAILPLPSHDHGSHVHQHKKHAVTADSDIAHSTPAQSQLKASRLIDSASCCEQHDVWLSVEGTRTTLSAGQSCYNESEAVNTISLPAFWGLAMGPAPPPINGHLQTVRLLI